MGSLDASLHLLRPYNFVQFILKLLYGVLTDTVLRNCLALEEFRLVLQVRRHVLVWYHLLLLILLYPLCDVDLVNFESNELHEDQLVDLGTLLVVGAQHHFPESDLVLKRQLDSLADCEGQNLLHLFRENLIVPATHLEKVVLELVSPVLEVSDAAVAAHG